MLRLDDELSLPPVERPKMAIDAFLQCFEDQYRLLHKARQVLPVMAGH